MSDEEESFVILATTSMNSLSLYSENFYNDEAEESALNSKDKSSDNNHNERVSNEDVRKKQPHVITSEHIVSKQKGGDESLIVKDDQFKQKLKQIAKDQELNKKSDEINVESQEKGDFSPMQSIDKNDKEIKEGQELNKAGKYLVQPEMEVPLPPTSHPFVKKVDIKGTLEMNRAIKEVDIVKTLQLRKELNSRFQPSAEYSQFVKRIDTVGGHEWNKACKYHVQPEMGAPILPTSHPKFVNEVDIEGGHEWNKAYKYHVQPEMGAPILPTSHPKFVNEVDIEGGHEWNKTCKYHVQPEMGAPILPTSHPKFVNEVDIEGGHEWNKACKYHVQPEMGAPILPTSHPKFVNEMDIEGGQELNKKHKPLTQPEMGDFQPSSQFSKFEKLWEKPYKASGDDDVSTQYDNMKKLEKEKTSDCDSFEVLLSHSATQTKADNSLNSWIDLNQPTGPTAIMVESNNSAAPISLNKKSTTRSESLLEASSSSSVNNDLAASFIMGEIDADVLKTSVYSQFPSISINASAEDVVKLQNLVTDHIQLKSSFTKFINTIRMYHQNTLQWKESLKKAQQEYREKLHEYEEQMKELRLENQRLKESVELQKEQTSALAVACERDREEMIQTFSEKTAIIENMRAQIMKLELAQLASYDLLPETHPEMKDICEKYVTREAHDFTIDELKKQISELLAKNLDLEDLEKQYIDELNCLKVNLTAAEELIKQSYAEIQQLKAMDLSKQQELDELHQVNDQLRQQVTENREHIAVLEQRNDVHKRDFELEKKSHDMVASEKHQILHDLRILQKRNKELIEERQKWLDEQLAVREENQRQQQAGVQAKAAEGNYSCPICSQRFQSLNTLHGHVNACIDETL